MDPESDMVVDIKYKCVDVDGGNPLHSTLTLPDGSCLKQVQRQIATIEFSIKISVLILLPLPLSRSRGC